MLTKCVRSVAEQTDRDVEHLFLVDRAKRGRWEADKALDAFKDRVIGRYAYILDDDCRLTEPAFVATVRDFCEKNDYPDVVMVRSVRRQIAPPLLPHPDVWGDPEKLRLATTNCLCYVVENDTWREHIWAFGSAHAAGDWFFLQEIRNSGASFGWLDLCVAETMQIGSGVKMESVKGDWFGPVASAFGIEEIARDDWRLRHWLRDAPMTGEEVMSILEVLPPPPEDVQQSMVKFVKRQKKRKKGSSLLERRQK